MKRELERENKTPAVSSSQPGRHKGSARGGGGAGRTAARGEAALQSPPRPPRPRQPPAGPPAPGAAGGHTQAPGPAAVAARGPTVQVRAPLVVAGWGWGVAALRRPGSVVTCPRGARGREAPGVPARHVQGLAGGGAPAGPRRPQRAGTKVSRAPGAGAAAPPRRPSAARSSQSALAKLPVAELGDYV